uniref:Transmembrane protein n=1 Tax=Globodera pallida TaxID=36090 RepID=A0A183CE77_GLOPA
MSSVRSISSTARAGNVLVLLDLYASGFASSTASPTIPMLTSRTISFPLNFWLALLFVVAAISGTMLIILLMMLCVENAFAHRLDITAFLEWLYGFNNFRVAFLFMLLHDAPITLANFFLLSACRCTGPNVLSWPLLLSSLAMALSLSWRLCLLRFAYARLVFRPSGDSNSAFPSRNQSFRNHFAADPSTASQAEGNTQLDEGWAIRRATAAVYGVQRGKSFCGGTASGTLYLGENDDGEQRCLRQCCGFWLSWVLLKSVDLLFYALRRLLCVLLSVFFCLACLSVGCAPCLHHYTCSRNSFSHRHKCAKSFVRNCTLLFHYVVFGFSLCFSVFLILLNVILIFSTQLVGPNQWPPEINRLCISVSPHQRIVRPLFLSESTFFLSSPQPIHPGKNKEGNAAFQQSSLAQCKPLWDLPHQQTFLVKWAPGQNRLSPSPWQARFPLQGGSILAVSVHFFSDHSAEQSPRHTLLYDIALLTFGSDNLTKTADCARQRFSGWFFANSRNDLGFPYFWGCSPTISIRKGALINCLDLTKY